MQVSNMSNQYIFDSPSPSRVQIGRLDTTTSSEQKTTTDQSEVNKEKKSETFQELNTKEVQEVKNPNFKLDIYA